MNLQKLKSWNWSRDDDRMPMERGGLIPRSRFHNEIDRLFDEFFEGFGMMPKKQEEVEGVLHPRLDIEERDKEYLLSVELPGVDKDNIDITFNRGMLTLRGEKRFENEEKKDNFHRIERSYGTFQRSLSLPEDADAEKIKAKFKDGVLTLHVPRTQVEKRDVKRIDIQS